MNKGLFGIPVFYLIVWIALVFALSSVVVDFNPSTTTNVTINDSKNVVDGFEDGDLDGWYWPNSSYVSDWSVGSALNGAYSLEGSCLNCGGSSIFRNGSLNESIGLLNVTVRINKTRLVSSKRRYN